MYRKVLKMPIGWFDKDGNQIERLGNRIAKEGRISKGFFAIYFPHLFVGLANIFFGIIMAFYF